MSDSTPDDLAVAFRSLARRQREAIGDADPSAFGDLDGRAAASRRRRRGDAVGSAPDGDAVAAAIDVAAATGTTPRWRRCGEHALDAGAVLRRLAAAAAESSDDD